MIRFESLSTMPDLAHGITTSRDPDFGAAPPETPAHAALTADLAGRLGLAGIAWARQVHGGAVLRVETPGFAGEADALWTDRPGLGVMGRSADCPLVLLAGRRADGTALWGMAHASWRSTVAGITGRLLAAMVAAGLAPSGARAAVSPSAGPCCYEVGEEVRAAALAGLGPGADAFFTARDGRIHLDLWAANVDVLVRGGVAPAAIEVSGHCTICGEGFPSYRRDGERAGRFGAALGCLR
jgi:YfiH family protein